MGKWHQKIIQKKSWPILNNMNKKTFKEKVLDVVGKIKKGEVLTYKEVGQRAGRANAARAVGTIMSHNTDKKIPCHRVVRSDGKIGEYNGLRGEAKEKLLEREGVKVINGRVIFGK